MLVVGSLAQHGVGSLPMPWLGSPHGELDVVEMEGRMV